MHIEQILDLDRYPLHEPDCNITRSLVTRCQSAYQSEGMFNLPELVRPEAIQQCVRGILPKLASESYVHCRDHNIYFDDDFNELQADHPALRILHTENRKICADQVADNLITDIYQWQPVIDFIARVLSKPQLYVMSDPLASINIMEYSAGQVLNWHFDRAEFTTTLLLQNSTYGGEFQYRQNLRSESNPNFDGVARMLTGEDGEVKTVSLAPGTLNVFSGRNSAHRITPVSGKDSRIIAVLSYYETPNSSFTDQERLYFYGRTGY